jgi:hypothetical protein
MSQHTATATESPRRTARLRAGRGGPLVRAVVLAAVGVALVLGARRPCTPRLRAAGSASGWCRYAGFRLRIENQVIDPERIEIYRVEQLNGPWQWLKVEGQGPSGGAPAG